ncbi:MAG: 50S ribosomal protein L21e [Candidatus Diapherotrites archaeon]|nr:50S ribosomal protein L21e [Candidatus Diapherotrites archaeon]
MAKKTHGSRVKSRRKLKKRDLTRVTDLIREFAIGTRALIKIDSSVHYGQPHPRFHGRVGAVTGKQGRSWLVEVVDGGKKKQIISASAHLKPSKSV